MPLTQALLFYVPTFILGVVIVTLFVALSVGSLLLVRRFVPHHKFKVHNDVAGAIFNTLGVAYTVLLAFVVVIAWQSFDKTNLNVEREANCLVGLYRDAVAFPEAFGGEARGLIRSYIDVVINDEWPALARGQAVPAAHELLRKLWAEYVSYEPKTENEKIFLAESVRKLNEIGELRRLRLMDAKTGIHPILWAILIVGGVITVSFPFFFGSENLRAQIAMASMLALVIALILFTVLMLDFPFTGSLYIPSDAFKFTANF